MNKNQQGIAPIIVILIVVGVLVVGGGAYYVAKNRVPAGTKNLEALFDLGHKVPGTKIYYSEKLGVGFTYAPMSVGAPSFPVAVSEIENKIYVSTVDTKPEQGQSIEVFTKDPKMTLQEAIQEKFLTGYNSKDCFIATYDFSEYYVTSYMSTSISFPPPADPEEFGGKNADKCPKGYSRVTGFFFMNSDVPGKFFFLKTGQETIASDGTPARADGSLLNWSKSIKIIK